MAIEKIDRETLNFILRASRSSHPNEFSGILRSEGEMITEVLVLPGTYSSERAAWMRLHMLPISSGSCGSVHSHTSPNPDPSGVDLNFFDKFGDVHVIVASPYNENSWKAFDRRGIEVKLDIVESELGGPVSRKPREDFWGSWSGRDGT